MVPLYQADVATIPSGRVHGQEIISMEHNHKVKVPYQIFVYQSTTPVIAHGPAIILLSWYALTMLGVDRSRSVSSS